MSDYKIGDTTAQELTMFKLLGATLHCHRPVGEAGDGLLVGWQISHEGVPVQNIKEDVSRDKALSDFKRRVKKEIKTEGLMAELLEEARETNMVRYNLDKPLDKEASAQ